MPQSPERSGTLEAGKEAGGPIGRKFVSVGPSIGGTGDPHHGIHGAGPGGAMRFLLLQVSTADSDAA